MSVSAAVVPIGNVLLDNCSRLNYMTEKMASLLSVPKYLVDFNIFGLNFSSTEVKHSVVASIKSRFNNYKKTLNVLFVKQITKKLPSIPLNRMLFQIPSNIYLADSEFLQVQRSRCPVSCPSTLQTIYARAAQPKEVVCHISQTEVDSISDQLERF